MREFLIKPGQVVIWKGRSFGPRQERMLVEDGFSEQALNQAIGETVYLAGADAPPSPKPEAPAKEATQPPPEVTPAEDVTPKSSTKKKK